jgi:hypothetical protein
MYADWLRVGDDMRWLVMGMAFGLDISNRGWGLYSVH